MKFEISYACGTQHEVDFAGSVAVLGRDPGCDIVLNDTKCSRRHAVIEDGPEGLVIRDSGSANGVRVNERRVEKALLQPGDTIRIGDVRIKVLGEVGETVVVALDDVEMPSGVLSPAPTLRPPHEVRPQQSVFPSSIPGRQPAARPPLAATRPPTVGVLSGLWALFVPVAVASLAFAAWRVGAGLPGWAAAIVFATVLTGGGVAMSAGLRSMAPWARHLQVVTAYLGLVVCPLTLASATVLLYMSRPDVRRTFEPEESGTRPDGAGPAEPTFALSIVAMVVVGIGLSAAALWLFAPQRLR